MSRLATSLLMLNIGCETVFVVDQRLLAQSIAKEKGAQVLNALIEHLLDPERLKRWFEPQNTVTLSEVRGEMEKLVNCSIMKINGTSLDKLFDLAVTQYKYQNMCSSKLEQIVEVTRVHLSELSKIVDNLSDRRCSSRISSVRNLVDATFSKISNGELHRIRQYLLQVLQDHRVKVSVLLNAQLQNANGSFYLPSPITANVGKCNYYDESGALLRTETVSVFYIQVAKQDEVLDQRFPLGSNLFTADRLVLPPTGPSSKPVEDSHNMFIKPPSVESEHFPSPASVS